MNDATFMLDLFVGRFHPVVVHLPIGFLMLLGILEFLALKGRFKHLAGPSRAILFINLPVAAIAAGTGWLLAGAGDYNPGLLGQHRWAGVAVAAGSALLLIIHQRHQVRLYRWGLAAMMVLLGFTGHQGGSLTHGSDYLIKHAPAPLRRLLGAGAPKAPFAKSTYQLAVQPILDRCCVSCHGQEKIKGGLRLDSFEAVMKGGENGPVVVVGKSADSELLRRSRLPDDHDDHMPPAGKPQPTAEELATIARWIDAGASPNASQ